MLVDFQNKSVLITGGTRGIGLSTALIFAELGARCVLTYKWGSEDEEQLIQHFLAIGALKPILIQADVADCNDTTQLMNQLKEEFQKIDIFVSNVSLAAVIRNFDDYSLRTLKESIHYGAWPVYEYTQSLKNIFGQYPKYVIGVSSTGPDQYSYGYDYIASTKAVMETLCRYMAYRLREEQVHVNVVRSRAIKTKSLENTFGLELFEFARQLGLDGYWITPEEVAGTIVMLCSGLMDAVNGQVINVDRGTSFFDNVMEIYTRHKLLPIFSQYKQTNK